MPFPAPRITESGATRHTQDGQTRVTSILLPFEEDADASLGIDAGTVAVNNAEAASTGSISASASAQATPIAEMLASESLSIDSSIDAAVSAIREALETFATEAAVDSATLTEALASATVDAETATSATRQADAFSAGTVAVEALTTGANNADARAAGSLAAAGLIDAQKAFAPRVTESGQIRHTQDGQTRAASVTTAQAIRQVAETLAQFISQGADNQATANAAGSLLAEQAVSGERINITSQTGTLDAAAQVSGFAEKIVAVAAALVLDAALIARGRELIVPLPSGGKLTIRREDRVYFIEYEGRTLEIRR